jgi:hypothetical protein
VQLPAAVSPLTRDIVMGEARAARVLAAFPTALYLVLDESAGARQVLPVVTADALLLPTALRLGMPSSGRSWPIAPGDEAVVGGGGVIAPAFELRGVRDWRPSRVETGLALPGVAALDLLPDGGVLGRLCTDLAAAALAGQPVTAHVAGLVGAGLGLTPSGDDALCGVLLGLRAWASPAPAAAVADVIGHARHRTTDLSASLLMAAADGYAVPQVVSLLRALAGGGSDLRSATLVPALEAVLAIGHSSGRDLVSGLVGTLRALSGPTDPITPLPVHVSPSSVQSHPEGIPRG